MIDQTPHDWIESLKAGDQFAINSRYRGYEIYTIERVTATQIVFRVGASEQRAKRDTGRVMGAANYERIIPVTQAIIDAIERNKLIRNLTYLKDAQLAKVPLANLRQAYLLLSVEEVKS